MPPFNPFNQTIVFHQADGAPFHVELKRIDEYMQYCIRMCIDYGAQFGASMILMIVLILLTRPDKRLSAVFLLNCFALLLNAIRLLCQIIYFTTGFTELYRYFSHDFDGIPTTAYATSIAGVVAEFLVMVCALSSLVLQVHVVCTTVRRRYRNGLLVITALVALVPLGFRLAYVIEISRQIIGLENNHARTFWLDSSTNISFTTSICFFCAIFVSKLGFAMKQRRRLGVREFGPMKVIFIMGCQTMFIPAVFSIFPYYIPNVPGLSSDVITIVTIFLPLSSIWAGRALDHQIHNKRNGSSHSMRNLPSFWNSVKARLTSSAGSASAITYYQTPIVKTSTDLGAGHRIFVERAVSVHSDERILAPATYS